MNSNVETILLIVSVVFVTYVGVKIARGIEGSVKFLYSKFKKGE